VCGTGEGACQVTALITSALVGNSPAAPRHEGLPLVVLEDVFEGNGGEVLMDVVYVVTPSCPQRFLFAAPTARDPRPSVEARNPLAGGERGINTGPRR